MQCRRWRVSISGVSQIPRALSYTTACTWASAHGGKWDQLTSPWKNGWKIKKRKHAKKSSFLCLYYTLRALRAGRCNKGRYADDIFIQIYFRMHHFVVTFSKFSSPQAARGQWGIDPPNQNPADVPELVCLVMRIISQCRCNDFTYCSLRCANYVKKEPVRATTCPQIAEFFSSHEP